MFIIKESKKYIYLCRIKNLICTIKMKTNFLSFCRSFCVFVLFTTSCTNNASKSNPSKQYISDLEIYDFTATIKECKTDQIIPPSYNLGEVIEYEGQNKMERNMLSQFKSHNHALMLGDIDNAMHYQYPDATTYFRKFYPNERDEAITRSFFNEVSEEMINAVSKYEEHGVTLEIVVSRMLRKITLGDNIVYVFEIVSNMKNEKLQLHTAPDETIAVSFNNGKNWTFNAVNEDTPNILRIRYPEEMVDKIMGY